MVTQLLQSRSEEAAPRLSSQVYDQCKPHSSDFSQDVRLQLNEPLSLGISSNHLAIRSSLSPPSQFPLHHGNGSPNHTPQEETFRYLAYGSNLSAETFLGRRGIRPISQQNVYVPSLRLTFDLPGLPYIEPCFANTALRKVDSPGASVRSRISQERPDEEEKRLPNGIQNLISPPKYHKDRWNKPLVGVLYELTPEDFTHVIATEGGGASYQDILVECFPLDEGAQTVPSVPLGSSKPVLAHTLFAPYTPPSSSPPAPTSHFTYPNTSSNYWLPFRRTSIMVSQINSAQGSPADSSTPNSIRVSKVDRITRPDPSYAQPSSRYLKLITDGAREHKLPEEYREYLASIRPYVARTLRQRMGLALFTALWMPIVILLFTLMQQFADENGRAPQWVVRIQRLSSYSMWGSYDIFYKRVFGDGERSSVDMDDDGFFEFDGVGEKMAHMVKAEDLR